MHFSDAAPTAPVQVVIAPSLPLSYLSCTLIPGASDGPDSVVLHNDCAARRTRGHREHPTAEAGLAPPSPNVRVSTDVGFDTAGGVRLAMDVYRVGRGARPALIFFNQATGPDRREPAYQGLTVNGVPDPRVVVVNTGRTAQDNVTKLWLETKFNPANAAAATAPLRIASWAEAQLIYAEATRGQAGFDAINKVRAVDGIGPLVMADPNDATAFQTAVLEERRREFFSEGQRYGDMLRKGLPFQQGTNRKGQTYSNLTCVPLPDVETLNNPNIA